MNLSTRNQLGLLAVVAGSISLNACQTHQTNQQQVAAHSINEVQIPEFIHDPIHHVYYDGVQNDLLTAGLGIAGLQAKPPTFTDPLKPTVEELRRNRIHYNYNAIVDTTTAGGFGVLYGPKAGQERISGHEYISVSRYENGSIAAVLMVQVPDSFNPEQPCIITAPSSGSRGIYGAIGTAGEWGLTHNCAVAYTDKGTGTGFYLQDQNQSYDIFGQLTSPDNARALFAPENPLPPHSIAVKHAHSTQNVEKDWGKFVLQSIEFSFHLLNKHHPARQAYTRKNTLVIASSISNGGNSSLRAAEQDKHNWIDAVVVSEPNIQLAGRSPITIRDSHGDLPTPRTLLDISTYFSLYQGCAALATAQQNAPFAAVLNPIVRQALANRCQALKEQGLLTGNNTESLAKAAQQKLLDYGALPETLPLGAFSTAIELWEALAVTYTNAYGRYPAEKTACDVNFSFTDVQGAPSPLKPAVAASLASISGGIVPLAGIKLINGNAGNKALGHTMAFQGTDDKALATLHCLRKAFLAQPTQNGISEVLFKGDLQGKPAIIVHGRHDHLIHVNHSSRPYLALNKARENHESQLHYYEITHGQHFDSLLRYPDFSKRYIPMHYYYDQAMNIMWAHLTDEAPIPPSQVVPAKPASADTAIKLPAISAQPGEQTITIKPDLIVIP